VGFLFCKRMFKGYFCRYSMYEALFNYIVHKACLYRALLNKVAAPGLYVAKVKVAVFT
jgi:hypothetical protein